MNIFEAHGSIPGQKRKLEEVIDYFLNHPEGGENQSEEEVYNRY